MHPSHAKAWVRGLGSRKNASDRIRIAVGSHQDRKAQEHIPQGPSRGNSASKSCEIWGLAFFCTGGGCHFYSVRAESASLEEQHDDVFGSSPRQTSDNNGPRLKNDLNFFLVFSIGACNNPQTSHRHGKQIFKFSTLVDLELIHISILACVGNGLD